LLTAWGLVIAVPGVVLALPLYVLLVRRGWTHPVVLVTAASAVGYGMPLLWAAYAGWPPAPSGSPLYAGVLFALGGAVAGAAAWVAGHAPSWVDRRLVAWQFLTVVVMPPALFALAARMTARALGLKGPWVTCLLTLVLTALFLLVRVDVTDPLPLQTVVPATLLWAGAGSWLLHWLEQRRLSH
jgi:hypothetical protein